MVNGPPCAVCGFTLRWLPQQNSWGCDRCQRMFPASGPGAPQQQAAPQAPSPWAPGGAPQQPYQQQGFGRPAQPPSYPPQQPAQPAWQQPPQQPQPYGQPPQQPNPYAPQAGYGQQPPQQYTPHPSQPPQPVPPVASPGGKKGGKGLLIGGAIAAVAIAGGVVAFVMLRGGGGTKGGDGRDAVVKSTLAALGTGDVDQLLRLSDIPGLYEKVIDCSGKTEPRDKPSSSDDDEETADPKKQVEKMRKQFETEVVPLTKGAKIELVEITTKVPPEPKDKPKGDKPPDADEEEFGFLVPIGARMSKGCYSKVPMRFHTAKLKVKVTPKGESAIEQDTKVSMLQVGNGFWLASPPHLNLGTAALERELTAIKDKVCACDKADCASKLKDEFKDGRGKEIKKQIRELSDKDKERIDKIEDEIKACERKLEGGEQLVAMEGFKDKICACNDQPCVDKVTQEMTVYGKTHSGDKLSESDMKKVTAIGEEMGKCMTKVAETERMRNPPPETTNGGIGSTIAGSTDGVTGGPPPACAEYMKTLEALMTCKAIPSSSRKDIESSMKQLPQMWKDYDRLPAASKKTIDDGCTQGADAMKQSLAALKC